MTYDKPRSAKVPGTGRREWHTHEGEVLHYQHIYMRPHTWELLKDIASSQGISGSQAMERLITKAAGYTLGDKRQDW